MQYTQYRFISASVPPFIKNTFYLSSCLLLLCSSFFKSFSIPSSCSRTTTGIVSEEAHSVATQTIVLTLHCRPHVQEKGLQALSTRRNLPQHNASFQQGTLEASQKYTRVTTEPEFRGTHTHMHALMAIHTRHLGSPPCH